MWVVNLCDSAYTLLFQILYYNELFTTLNVHNPIWN